MSLKFTYKGTKFDLWLHKENGVLFDLTNDEFVWSWPWKWHEVKFAWSVFKEHVDTNLNWRGSVISKQG